MSDAEEDVINRREVAYRLFAAEFEDADHSYSESDDDRAPNYVITPTGARVNRLFVVGVLTEVEHVSDDVLRGRIVDPTGAFVTYAGQYQPDEQAFLERVETPTFVAMTGKARTFQPDDSEQVFTSVRPESLNVVSAETRDRWIVQTASQTLDRIGHIATAITLGTSGEELEQALLDSGVDEGLAAGISIALDHYGTTPTYLDGLRELSLDAVRVVADELDQVDEFRVSPTETGAVTAADLKETAGNSLNTDSTTVETTTPETEAANSVPDSAATEAVPETPEESPADDSSAQERADGSTDHSPEDDQRSVEDQPEELGDFDPEEFDLDEETREQVKEDHGVEFQTGTEVESPSESSTAETTPESTRDETTADSSAKEQGEPEQDESTEAPTVESSDTTTETLTDEGAVKSEDTATDEITATNEETATSEKPPTDEETSAKSQPNEEQQADPEDAVVELMEELDDGDGVPRETLIDEMGERYGIDGGESEDAIQDALMQGKCYEPADGTLKSI